MAAGSEVGEKESSAPRICKDGAPCIVQSSLCTKTSVSQVMGLRSSEIWLRLSAPCEFEVRKPDCELACTHSHDYVSNHLSCLHYVRSDQEDVIGPYRMTPIREDCVMRPPAEALVLPPFNHSIQDHRKEPDPYGWRFNTSLLPPFEVWEGVRRSGSWN